MGMALIAHKYGGTLDEYIDWVTPQSQGSPCNGTDDDTDFINTMVNAFSWVRVPAGNYVLDCNRINLSKSNVTIEFDVNANVTVKNTAGVSGAGSEAALFRCVGSASNIVQNITIRGGQFSYSDDTVVICAIGSYTSRIHLERTSVYGPRLLSVYDGTNAYASSSSATRPKHIAARFNRVTAATISTSGAAICFRYCDGFATEHNIIDGFYYGTMFWGGDSNPSVNGALANERKSTNGRFNNDVITAYMAGCWGSMGYDVIATGVRAEASSPANSDVGIDFEGCVKSGGIGCYAKGFRYGQFAAFFLNDGVFFEGCTGEVTVSGHRVFTINNSTQTVNNREVSFTNCKFVGLGVVSYTRQQGAVGRLSIVQCTFRNVNLHLDSLNNDEIILDGLQFTFDTLPDTAITLNSVDYYAALAVNGNNVVIQNVHFSSDVTWTGLSGTTVALLIVGRGSNSNQHINIRGGGTKVAYWGYDIIFGNAGSNNGISPKYRVNEFMFSVKAYKTVLMSTSTLYPIGFVDGLTTAFVPFPVSLTDNAGYAETYYYVGQQFKKASPTGAGGMGAVVSTSGVGSAAVTAAY